MWTPKRVLILLAGLTACLVAFALYSTFLGNIDGLPPLPRIMLGHEGHVILPPHRDNGNEADLRLEKGFGTGCEEMRRPLRIWLPDKGIAFSAGEFNIDKKNGSIRLAPFSVAMYHKGTPRGAHPEITTIKCDIAIITLDQPITQFSQLTNSNRKIIAVEMQGGRPGVTIGSNRKSAEKSDDIDILITGGPLFYEDRQKLIWTQGVVCVTDYKTKPATVIRGKGLDMHLARENNTPRPKGTFVNQNAVSGDSHNVEKLVLRSDVEMHFWVDSRLGFLGGAANSKPAPQPVSDETAAASKAHIHIRTGGSFTYDLTKEFARFDSPPPAEGNATGTATPPIAPDQVHVDRIQSVDKKESRDQLTCDRLELQFRRKAIVGNAALANAGNDKDIESAKAIARPGNEVVLALDTERLAAYGAEFVYRAGDAVSGPVTILKGDANRPVKSFKDGHQMKCRELHLFGANRLGEGQKVVAYGPGAIDLLDHKNIEKPAYPTHVHWRETLVVEQKKDAGQVFDEITVIGDAAFIDDIQPQKLEAEKIQLWLRNNRESTNRRNEAFGNSRQQLTKLEAYDRVHAVSPETIIRRAARLTVIFDHQVATQLPAEVKHQVGPPNKGVVGATLPDFAKEDSSKIKPVSGIAKDQKKRKPIEVEGNEITSRVIDFGSKKQLEAMDCRGNVRVVQAGEKANEKGIDITGQLLTLRHLEGGDTLVVHGDKEKFAKLEIGDSTLWGRIVTLNQSTNQADVNGSGAMEMLSNKNLDGSETTKKNTRIRIHWNQNMTFDGRHAYFYGGVMAHEVGAFAKMQCQNMTVILDRQVSFKQASDKGEKKKDQETAKIDRILCDRNVFIDDAKVDVIGTVKHLKQRNIIIARDATMDNQAGPTNFTGPGEVRFLGMSATDLTAAPIPMAPVEPKKNASGVWKLTRIQFRDRAFSNTKAATRNATFFGDNGGVEVFHFPSIDINAKLDPDNPSKDSLYLRCGILKVDGEQNLDRVSQTMIAQQNVFFRTDKYLGTADILKYDEKNDIIILEGLNGNVVRLFQMVDGQQSTVATSTKVLYNRKTGKIDTEGVRSIMN